MLCCVLFPRFASNCLAETTAPWQHTARSTWRPSSGSPSPCYPRPFSTGVLMGRACAFFPVDFTCFFPKTIHHSSPHVNDFSLKLILFFCSDSMVPLSCPICSIAYLQINTIVVCNDLFSLVNHTQFPNPSFFIFAPLSDVIIIF